MSSCRRARPSRPRVLAPEHSAQVQRGEYRGVLEGQVSDLDSSGVHRWERNFTGYHFGARGYCVSTVRLDEETVRTYIREQEEEEKRQEQLTLGGLQPPLSPKKGLWPLS